MTDSLNYNLRFVTVGFLLRTFDGFDEHLLFSKATVFRVCHQCRATHERIRAFNTQSHILSRIHILKNDLVYFQMQTDCKTGTRHFHCIIIFTPMCYLLHFISTRA